VRWEIEHLLNGNLSQEYSYQKLLKSDNPSSSYNRKCQGCFLRHCVILIVVVIIIVVVVVVVVVVHTVIS